MRPITTVTQFIQEISSAIDQGYLFGVEEVEIHIEKKIYLPG
jgi:hypothetical protein